MTVPGGDFRWEFYHTYDTLPWEMIEKGMYPVYENEEYIVFSWFFFFHIGFFFFPVFSFFLAFLLDAGGSGERGKEKPFFYVRGSRERGGRNMSRHNFVIGAYNTYHRPFSFFLGITERIEQTSGKAKKKKKS